MHAMNFFIRRCYCCSATAIEPAFGEQRTTRGSLFCLVNIAVWHLQFLRSALIAAAYEKVPMEIFGQESVLRAASSFIVQASIKLPITNRPFARTSRHFIVGVPSGNEITPCAADNSAVASRCDSVGAASAPLSARNSSIDVTKIS